VPLKFHDVTPGLLGNYNISKQLCRSWISLYFGSGAFGGFQTIGAWFVDNPTATAAWFTLLIAIGTFICQISQGQRLPSASKVVEWIAYNDFRQYCESQLDKGNLWNDCNKTLDLQMKAPPLTDSDAFMQDDKLSSRRRPLAKRTDALLPEDHEHGKKPRPRM
jgi:hypothetical protein